MATDITGGNKKERVWAHSLTATDSPLCVPALFIRLLNIQNPFDVLFGGT